MKMLYIKHRSGKIMNNFAISAILAAKELGIDFTLANNMSMAEPGHFEKVCEQYGIRMVHIDFDRNPLSKNNLKARKQLLELMQKENYDIMHCNTPSGGMVGRLCAAQMKTPKVIYMAHGFHFWKGAPLKNWLLYYVVERFLARFTDRLITINREDYELAQRFNYKKGGKAVYVPGVGIDPKKYAPNAEKRTQKRQELGILDGETMLLSVGEVNQNKNHKVVIEALAKWQRKDIRYVICGIGPMEAELKKLVETLGLAAQVTFAGYRTDIGDYYQAADVFVISSYREGLPVAPMEAMTACIPCVASRIRGSVDLLADSSLLFDAGDSDSLLEALKKVMDPAVARKEVARNNDMLQLFSLDEAVAAMKRVYMEVMNDTV